MEKILILIFIFVFSFSAVSAQEQNQTFPLIPKYQIEEPSCDTSQNAVGGLKNYFSRNELIIIISHTGTNEKESFGKRRLHNAKMFYDKAFLKEYTRPPESILIAEGEKVKGRGYLDFYIAGKLELRIVFRKNADLWIGKCVIDPGYEKPCKDDLSKWLYPCKDRNSKRK
ncbi:MAG TPA: hypothetical protein VGB00_12360 [Pyrinomonadaceae bacterium]|jgi:hypothetical protein